MGAIGLDPKTIILQALGFLIVLLVALEIRLWSRWRIVGRTTERDNFAHGKVGDGPTGVGSVERRNSPTAE